MSKKLHAFFRTNFLKTMWVNFKYCGFRGLFHFPILIARGVQLRSLKGKIELDKMKIGYLRIGYSSLGTQNEHGNHGCLQIEGTLKVHGQAKFGQGSSISIGKTGVMEVGTLFVNGNTDFICYDHITIGNDCLISWGVTIMDTDFHHIYQDGSNTNVNQPISIGDHCWIGMRTIILKGADIPDETVIAAGSVVTKKLAQSHCVYAGNQIIKSRIDWHE
jgi:acetyltransferase-like isoleucine patch superfamily enzyme